MALFSWPSLSLQWLYTLLLCTLSIVVCATLWDKNETTRETDSIGTEASTIPIPGYTWLSEMASSETAFEYDGVTYTSSYDAMLYGNPADNPCRNFNCFINSFLFSSHTAAWFISKLGIEGAHYLLCYLRNLIGGMLVYYGTGAIFHYHCYIHPRSQEIFKDRERPTTAIMWDQIKLAQASLFLYVALPVFDEFLIERGFTQVYYTIQEIGGLHWYLTVQFIYFCFVEIGIYWMHRTLHTNKFLYKHVHMLHHKYNSADTLTPWASIAFNPIDGILQASPYVVLLPFVPCHYVTHMAHIFVTAIWATYIHDAMDWNVEPIMGSKYHTLHHTHYIYNYGQMFTFCDQFWGTYMLPQGKTGVGTRRKKVA